MGTQPRPLRIEPHTPLPGYFTRLAGDQALDGGDVLPGFTLSLRELFDRAHRGPDD